MDRTVKELLVVLEDTKDAPDDPNDEKRKERDKAFRELYDQFGIAKVQCRAGQLIAK